VGWEGALGEAMRSQPMGAWGTAMGMVYTWTALFYASIQPFSSPESYLHLPP